jgi:hypothetical protein
VFVIDVCDLYMAISRCFVFSFPFAQDTSFFDFDNEKGGIGIAELEARLGKDVDECTHVMFLMLLLLLLLLLF